MAIIWQYQSAQTCYQVRKHGQSVRLYTNDVFHSQWNPAQVLTGSVWDLLCLPALMRKPSQVQRVLLLGVGGGAVLNMLDRLVQPQHVIDVELDAVHLEIAQHYFGCRHVGVQLELADASAFVSAYQGEPFEYIVDDMFIK